MKDDYSWVDYLLIWTLFQFNCACTRFTWHSRQFNALRTALIVWQLTTSYSYSYWWCILQRLYCYNTRDLFQPHTYQIFNDVLPISHYKHTVSLYTRHSITRSHTFTTFNNRNQLCNRMPWRQISHGSMCIHAIDMHAHRTLYINGNSP